MREQIKPVRTSAKELRELRDKEVIIMYKALMSVTGSQRTAVAKHISEAIQKLSYSNVMKITKNV